MIRTLATLGQRLKFARKQRGFTQPQLAELVGMKQPDISKIENGGIQQTTGIARLADVLQVPARWLETNEGPEPNWVNVQHANEGPPSSPWAHAVSHPQPTIDPILLAWESLVSNPLPDRFMVTVQDDSMSSPDGAGLAIGDRAIFETGRAPKPGRNVLVRDSLGNLFIREYRIRRPGQWQAVAKHPAYQALDSVADQLVIVAVQTGHLY